MMATPNRMYGTCICGALKIEAQPSSNGAGACHCKTCRRWCSGPYLSIECGQDVTISGGDHLTVFNSSDWAERGFCNKCGTNVFYRLKESGQYFLSVGLLDDANDIVLKEQVFIDEKPAYYSFSNDTREMTGAECFALYGASPSQ